MHHPAHLLLHGHAVVVALHDSLRWRYATEFFKSKSRLGHRLREQQQPPRKLRLHALVEIEHALHDNDGAAQPCANVPPAISLVHWHVAGYKLRNQPRHRHRLVDDLPRQAGGVQSAHAERQGLSTSVHTAAQIPLGYRPIDNLTASKQSRHACRCPALRLHLPLLLPLPAHVNSKPPPPHRAGPLCVLIRF